MFGPDGLESQVRKIESEGVVFLLDFETKPKGSISKLKRVTYRGRMVRFRMSVDLHVPIT